MISILLATYNGEKYIEYSIASILEQTYGDFELLVGFNGTTDKSKEIVSSIKDDRISIFDYGDDKGKARTLNKLLKEAKYDWIAMQDDDDIWTKDKLQLQMDLVDYFDVIGTVIQYINKDNEITGAPNLATNPKMITQLSLSGVNQIANSSAIFKKSDALEIGGWREIDPEDFDFWLRLMRKGKKFYNIPKCTVYHRLHPESNFNTKQFDLTKIL